MSVNALPKTKFLRKNDDTIHHDIENYINNYGQRQLYKREVKNELNLLEDFSGLPHIIKLLNYKVIRLHSANIRIS
jgi:hypothetical protein